MKKSLILLAWWYLCFMPDGQAPVPYSQFIDESTCRNQAESWNHKMLGHPWRCLRSESLMSIGGSTRVLPEVKPIPTR